LAAVGSSPLPARAARRLRAGGGAARTAWCAGYAGLAALSLAALVGNQYSPFLYFRF
ncbi:MAG TPA: transcriptional regulator, partial [Ruminococcaceae bacterium]|nr:transcriptional regulator [Oscillospiraceae bacterium]